MIDKRTSYLLNILNNVCQDGAYKVIEFNEIIEKMPRFYEITKENIVEDLRGLQERNYVALKYNDDNVVCLTTLAKARLYNEKSAELRQEKQAKIKLAYIALAVGAIGGFIGGFIGALIGSAI